MGIIEGHPRIPGLNARARRGSARLSTTDPDLVQASWESISRITLQRYLVYGSGRSGKLDEWFYRKKSVWCRV